MLELVAAGLGDKEIASRLGLSLPTVRSHLQRLYREHGFKNRADAAVAWIAYQTPVPMPAATPPAASPAPPKPTRRRLLPWAVPVAASLALALGLVIADGGVILSQRLTSGKLLQAAAQSSHGSSVVLSGHSTTPPRTPGPSNTARSTTAPSSATPQATLTTQPPPAKAPVHVPAPPAASPAIQVEAALAQLALVNQDRAASLRPALQWNGCLASAAAEAAHAAAQEGNLAAAQIGTNLGCGVGGVLAQNVGSWPAVNDAQMNAVFMADPIERARILGATHLMGAAWAHNATGAAFLVVVFA